jgi:hypothetical protein
MRLLIMLLSPAISRDSSVGIATGYRLDDRGVKNFYFTASRPALGSTQPPIQWVPGSKAVGRPTSAEVKKTWIYTSTPPYAFMV